MLVMGLNCNMGYGPGDIYYLWFEYLPNASLYFTDYDAACIEKWKEKMMDAEVHIGDQQDVSFLEEIISKSGGSFDVIVDNGGHSMTQQLVAFDNLFPALKPGGIYICEDLQSSFWNSHGGGPNNVKGTKVDRVKESMNDLMEKKARLPNMNDVWSIDCMAEVCSFSKKELDQKY